MEFFCFQSLLGRNRDRKAISQYFRMASVQMLLHSTLNKPIKARFDKDSQINPQSIKQNLAKEWGNLNLQIEILLPNFLRKILASIYIHILMSSLLSTRYLPIGSHIKADTMAGKNKRSTKKQTLLLSSQSAETSMASSQMVPYIELNAMGIRETVPRDGKGEYAAFEGKANGFPNLGNQLQSLKIGVDFSGPAKYLSTNAPDTPPFSPQMSSKSGLPSTVLSSTIPLLEAHNLYSHNRAYHKNTASTQSSVSTPGSYSYSSSSAAPRT